MQQEQRTARAHAAAAGNAGGHCGIFCKADISMHLGLTPLLPQVTDAASRPLIAAGGTADGRAITAPVTPGARGVQSGAAFLCQVAADYDAVVQRSKLRGLTWQGARR